MGVLEEKVEIRNKFKISRIEEEPEEEEEIKMEKEDVGTDRKTETSSNGTEGKIHSLLVPEAKDGKKCLRWESLELENIVNRERESLEDIVKRVI